MPEQLADMPYVYLARDADAFMKNVERGYENRLIVRRWMRI